jgi:hypothetical protein
VRLFWKKMPSNAAQGQGAEGSVWADVADLPVHTLLLAVSLWMPPHKQARLLSIVVDLASP